jgi:predicted MFS family arabinose efflux permease
MAKATWFQRFWRWTVVFLVVCLVVDFWEFSSYMHMVAPVGSSQVMQIGYEASAIAGQAFWSSLGQLLRVLFTVAVLMLGIVELVAWVKRWRRRRAHERDQWDFVKDRDREIFEDE